MYEECTATTKKDKLTPILNESDLNPATECIKKSEKYPIIPLQMIKKIVDEEALGAAMLA